MKFDNSVRAVVFASVMVAVFLGFRAFAETDVYYVPPAEGAGPYDWTTVANWYTDSAGTAPLGALPGTNDKINFAAGMASQKLTVPSGTAAAVYAIVMDKSGLELVVEDGARLNPQHTSTASAGGLVRVKGGGLFLQTGIFRLGSGSGDIAGTRVLIEEDGTYTNINYTIVGFGKSGSATFENHGDVYFTNSVYVGRRESSSSTASGIIDNYGTITTPNRGSTRLFLGCYPGTTGYLTNNVGGTVSLRMSLAVAVSNATGYVVNKGTFNVADQICYVGGDNLTSSNATSSKYPVGYFYNLQDATATFDNTLRLGGWKYGRGTFDNRGTATFNTKPYIGYYGRSQGSFVNHTTGRVNFNTGIEIGHSGTGTLESVGKLTFDNRANVVVGNSSGSVGTLNLYNAGRFVGDLGGITVAAADGAIGTVKMFNTSTMTYPGNILMGYGRAGQATFQMGDDAVLTAPGVTVIGVGRYDDTTSPWTGYANFTMSGNAVITNMNEHLYVASNRYGKALLELAGNSRIIYSNARGRNIYVGTSLKASTNSCAVLRLRGGEIVMATNSTFYVGQNSKSANGCNAFLTGWGRITRHKLESTDYIDGLNLTLYTGAITADGGGEAHDLDLSVFRKINDGAGNFSGTNGWYAINKGRLYYPCRYSGYTYLGDYYGRTNGVYFVNSVHFDFVGKDGHLQGQLYATDRDDIPAGLPEDDVANGVRRLGVWRAGVAGSYFSENFGKKRGTFTSAMATIRYDNFRLNRLKDGEGAFAADQRVCLYRYTGSQWVRVASVDAATAETDGYKISGTLVPVDDDWNLGFFAVVAEPKRGMALILR